MAKSLHFLFVILLLSSLTLTLTPVTGKKDHSSFGETLDQSFFSLKKQKLTHFRVYWHDILNGKTPSSVPIITPQRNYSATAFGLVRMIDNPLTLGPKLSPKIVGRAQGLYAAASEEEVGLLMAMNFAFVEGKYNGSTITVFGRNPVFEKVREMPVIGGSGLFRLARGYVQARTHEYDAKTGNAVVEYNCYVLHY